MILFWRELCVTLSQPRALLVRAGVLVLALGVALVLWYTLGLETSRRSELVARGRLLYRALLLSAMLGLVVFGSLGALGSVQRERDGGTLEGLLVSPLRSRSLLRQWFLAQVVAGAVLLLSIAPFVLLPATLGGTSPEDLILGLLRCGTILVLATAAGLHVATRAMKRAPGLELLRFLLFPFPVTAEQMNRVGRGRPALIVVCIVAITISSQYVYAIALPVPFLILGAISGVLHSSVELVAVTAALLGTWSLQRSSAERLRAESLRPGRGTVRRERFRTDERARAGRLRALARVAGRDRHGLAREESPSSARRRRISLLHADNPVGAPVLDLFRKVDVWLLARIRNPFVHAELRRQPSPFEEYGILLFAACGLFAVVALFISVQALATGTFADLVPVLATVARIARFLALLSLGVAIVFWGASTLPSMRDSGMLDTLRVSPLASWTLLSGKALHSAWRVRHGFAALFVLCATVGLDQGLSTGAHALFTALAFLVTAHCAALFVSGLVTSTRASKFSPWRSSSCRGCCGRGFALGCLVPPYGG